MPEASEAILVLSRADERFFDGLKSATEWNFDFKLFKEEEADAIVNSRSTEQSWRRSTAVRAHLQPGSYVVHVRLERSGVRDAVSILARRKLLCLNFLAHNASYQLSVPQTQATNFADRAPGKVRKLTRVLSELARSKSLAANFDAKYVLRIHLSNTSTDCQSLACRKWQNYLTVPVERLGGRTVHNIQSKDIQAESQRRKTLQMRFSSAQVPTLSTIQSESTPAKESESVTSVGLHRSDSPGVITTESQDSDKSTTATGVAETTDTVSSEVKEDDKDENKEEGAPASSEEESKEEDTAKADASATESTVPTPELPVHSNILCDGCKVRILCLHSNESAEAHDLTIKDGTEIKGTRWKCLVCDNYDLCDKCYKTGAHEHPMLPIEHPDDFDTLRGEVIIPS